MKLLTTFLLGWIYAIPALAEPLHLMSFNVRLDTTHDKENRWENRREVVAQFLAEQRPDILGVQEPLPHQMSDLQKALPGYVLVGCGREDGKKKGEFTAMLVNPARFSVVESGAFWFSDTPDVPGSRSFGNPLPRLAAWALLEDSNGNKLRVYNTHLDHQSQVSRERSIEKMLEHASKSEGACLMMGDFNVRPNNPALKPLLAAGWTDAHSIAPAEPEGEGTFHGWKGGAAGSRIDMFFYRAPVSAIRYKVFREKIAGRWLSDHHPVSLEIEWPPKK